MQTVSTSFRLFGRSHDDVLDVEIDAAMARRKVSGWVGMDVSCMMNGEKPILGYEDERAYWFVPVLIYSSTHGVIGEAGTVRVDAVTGNFDRSMDAARSLFIAGCKIAGLRDAELNQAVQNFEQVTL